MHQEILDLDRVVGLMRENTAVVLRKRNVVDGEFIEHGFSWIRFFGGWAVCTGRHKFFHIALHAMCKDQ
jgi:hypothetical protein